MAFEFTCSSQFVFVKIFYKNKVHTIEVNRIVLLPKQITDGICILPLQPLYDNGMFLLKKQNESRLAEMRVIVEVGYFEQFFVNIDISGILTWHQY